MMTTMTATYENRWCYTHDCPWDTPYHKTLENASCTDTKRTPTTDKPLVAVFTRADGTQVLVTRWESGAWEMAERERPFHTWGPPLQGDDAS